MKIQQLLVTLLLWCIALEALPSSPMIFFPFDNSVNGGEGTSIDGSIQGSAQFETGIAGAAISFSSIGERQAVVIDEYIPSFNSEHDLTVQFWFKTSQSGDVAPVIVASKQFDPNRSDTETKTGFALFMYEGTWGFNLGQDVRIKNLYVGKDTTIVGRLTYKRENGEYLPINDGEWHQFTMTYNNDQKNLRLYFDGINRVTYQTEHMGEFASSSPLVIGADGEGSSGAGDRFEGSIDNFALWERELTAAEILESYREFASQEAFTYEDNLTSLRVGVWNTMEGGTGVMGEAGISQTARIIRENELDIVLVQENYSCGDYIAAETGYYFTEGADRDYRSQGSNVAVHSRFPIERVWAKRDEVFYHIGTKIRISNTQTIFAASNWYPGGGSAIPGLFEMHRENLDAIDSIPFLWGGDFNQNSRADYNCKEVMERENFVDAYRELHPNAESHPGYTYGNSRIDFLYYRGMGITPTAFEIIDQADGGFPSDHNLLICDFELDYRTSANEVALERTHKAAKDVPFRFDRNNGIHLSEGVISLELFNMKGQVIQTFTMDKNQRFLSNADLNRNIPQGVYMMKVESRDNTHFSTISVTP